MFDVPRIQTNFNYKPSKSPNTMLLSLLRYDILLGYDFLHVLCDHSCSCSYCPYLALHFFLHRYFILRMNNKTLIYVMNAHLKKSIKIEQKRS